MMIVAHCAALILIASPAAAAEDAAESPARPRADTGQRHNGQRWPLVVEGGIQALGFKPAPVNATGSIGTEIGVVARRRYGLHLGLAVGGFVQRGFARAGFVDATLGQRLTARFGLYGDIDLVVGGQLSSIPGTTYRSRDGARLVASRAPARAAARLGLGLALGFDLGRVTRVPLRLFARYRQYAWTPFMTGNGLPAMGLATFSLGLAMEIGTWTTQPHRR